ncbi:gem-associated protein 6 [Microcaecilia unicolor]|uniref:Gem-associated protein 6 n=1 Tax=Microcaecilia unicolor TaxID=1415580 RepID=A0A6P7X868_9AMPH|nr:gem-associated protein 6 [Microcaecilia unicolor]XP_030051757.1 gem-associated protein 6 [Microcaecilia unicolor]
MTDWCKKSPLDWKDYMNKEIKVTADEKNEYRGWVLTVDPVTANIVLVNVLEDGKVSVTVVMGHAVQKVDILDEGNDEIKERLAYLFMPEEIKTFSKEDLEKRKNSLKSWLEQNHIPVTQQGDEQRTLCVAGVLTIDPPYGPENCSSSNEIILSRVQALIQSAITH